MQLRGDLEAYRDQHRGRTQALPAVALLGQLPWPADCLQRARIPPEVLASAERGFLRIYLATPAWFRAGHLPDPEVLLRGVGGDVVATVSDRPEVVSGWDQRRNEPKPTRRLLPAGAVLFVRLGGNEAARRAWAERIWLSCISDDEQSRRDGFGLALLGTWDGQCHEITLEDP